MRKRRKRQENLSRSWEENLLMLRKNKTWLECRKRKLKSLPTLQNKKRLRLTKSLKKPFQL